VSLVLLSCLQGKFKARSKGKTTGYKKAQELQKLDLNVRGENNFKLALGLINGEKLIFVFCKQPYTPYNNPQSKMFLVKRSDFSFNLDAFICGSYL